MEVVNRKIMIRCPGCIGTGTIIFYRNKDKSVKFVCKYCENTKEIPLSDYLEIMGRSMEKNRVQKYEDGLIISDGTMSET